MSSFLKNILRFILLILIQVFVLDKIHLHYLVTPYLYFVFVLWMPFKLSRVSQMTLAFLLGFTLDSFRHNPGYHAAACVLMAYFRPFLINLLIPQEGADSNYDEPSLRSMGGFFPYVTYITILILIHNMWLFVLEAWQFGSFWYFITKTLASTVISLLLLLLTDLLLNREQKFKTNTV